MGCFAASATNFDENVASLSTAALRSKSVVAVRKPPLAGLYSLRIAEYCCFGVPGSARPVSTAIVTLKAKNEMMPTMGFMELLSLKS